MKKNSGTDNVTNISDARERRENRDQGDVAPLEAHGPTAVKVDGTADDWLITGCDGDQVYIYLAVKKTKRSKTFTVTEVYPGLLKKRTALREADEPIDLVLLGKHSDLNEVLQDIDEDMVGDLEPEDMADDAE
ncbi:MAG: hypothetical protein V3T11_10050 [Roseateles sp.]